MGPKKQQRKRASSGAPTSVINKIESWILQWNCWLSFLMPWGGISDGQFSLKTVYLQSSALYLKFTFQQRRDVRIWPDRCGRNLAPGCLTFRQISSKRLGLFGLKWVQMYFALFVKFKWNYVYKLPNSKFALILSSLLPASPSFFHYLFYLPANLCL